MMLQRGVSKEGILLVSFAFNTIVAFGLCLDEFSKAFIKFLLRGLEVL
jgi:hypothetical protein